MWMMILPVVLFFGGALYFDFTAGWFRSEVHSPFSSLDELEAFQPMDEGGSILKLGQLKYRQLCEVCHGPDGMGRPGQAPPFAGSEWVVTDSVGRLIRIPLQGLVGPIMVKGELWNMNMVAMGATLSDEELAAVLSYMRNSWGNEAPFITPEQVAQVRQETQGRTQPWTAAELEALP
jgi:mono/diheme cytochrome c family protein